MFHRQIFLVILSPENCQNPASFSCFILWRQKRVITGGKKTTEVEETISKPDIWDYIL